MAGAKVPITFKIFKGDEFLREEVLTQPVIKVGKLSSSHLRLDDDSVSRMHAVVEVSGADDISIIDLGSTKGTLVNGQKVNKAKLQEGDLIQLGDIRIEMSVGAAVAEADDDVATRVNVPAAPDAPAETADSGVVSSVPRPSAPAAAPPPPTPALAPPTPPAPPTPSPSAFASAPPAVPSPAGLASAPAPAPAPRAAPPRPAAPTAASTAAAASQFGSDSVNDMGGARSIEVAAMLGDSVVNVKHVMNPRGGKVTPITYGLFIGGAFLCVIAAFAFFVGVGNAADNKESLHQWTEVEERPLHEWRPERISMAYDWMSLGGAIGGLLCITFGLVRLRQERIQPYYRIGSGAGVDFETDAAPAASFPLVAPSGDDFVVNFTQGMEGEMSVDGRSTPLSELRSPTPIPPKARFRLTTGAQTFLVSSVPQPRKQPVPLFAALETTVLVVFLGSAIFHLGGVALLNSLDPDRKGMSMELIGTDGRLSRVQSKPQEDPKQEEEEEVNTGKEDDSGGTGTKMALEEGKMGKKESTRQSGQYAMKNNNADPQLARNQAIDNARKAGVLGIMMQRPGGAFASLTGTADFSSGLDDRDVYGGLLGNEVGEMQGGWGYGISGTGPGGGGTGWGTIGTGRYGTIGHGSGTGSGYGTGSGRGGMRGRKARPPQVRIGNATATGDLDKAIIRRYIRRQLRRIQNCYERELLVKQSLAGTVVSSFTISPQGKVQGSKASGMGNGKVEGCVARVIKSITFPKPKGGGFVNVRYPFHFRQGGS